MSEKYIILFDGTCNLCNGSVKFIMSHDSRRRFTFASAQSPEGQMLCARHGFTGPTPGSVVLIDGNHVYVRSTATLQIARRLDGIWPIFSVFILIPAVLRDACYKFVAARRRKWFGTADQCVMIPAERRFEESKSPAKP